MAPALFVALPLLAGVLLGTSLDHSPPACLSALAAAWALAVWGLWRRRSLAVTTGVLAGFLAMGIVTGAEANRASAHPSLLAWNARNTADRPVHVEGVLREDAVRTTTAVSLTVDVARVDGVPLDGGVRVAVGGSLAAQAASEWRAGRRVVVDALLREPLDYRDPGVPSDRNRLARQRIVLVGTVKSAALTSVIARGGALSEAAGALRAFVRRATTRSIGPWSQRSAGIATAILIGDRGGLDPDDERRLQEAGTYHVIAISGGNIALLTALLVGLGRAARLPARATAAGSIALLGFYGYAAGLAPSVLRATLAGIVYLAARAADHRGAPLNAIAVAGAFAAVSAPLTLLDPGFALSFGATTAIVLSATRLAPPLSRLRGGTRAVRWVRWIIHGARMLLAATLCAEIALAPLGARLFGRVSFAGLALNFLAIPLMSVIQIAGIAAVASVALSVRVALIWGWVVEVATSLLLRSASLVDAAPWLVFDVPPPAFWLIAAWYAGWAGVLSCSRGWRRRAAATIAALAAVLMMAGLPFARAVLVDRAPPGWTRVVFLDVGQGDAALMQPPGGLPLLVDAGGMPGASFDLGRRVTLPSLWAFGVTRLGALILTHGDPDHIGGAPPLLRALAPREIWEGVPVPRHEPMRRLRAAAVQARIPWAERRTGDAFTAGPAFVRVLNPPPPDWERQKVRNDDSIVLELDIGRVAFILPGDITAAVEAEVLGEAGSGRLTIVKAPHHGSAGSSSQAFVEALHPAAVIFSAGRRNPFGHPAPVVVERYRQAGAEVFNTGEDGAVVVDTDGAQVIVWTYNGRKRVFTPGASSFMRQDH